MTDKEASLRTVNVIFIYFIIASMRFSMSFLNTCYAFKKRSKLSYEKQGFQILFATFHRKPHILQYRMSRTFGEAN